MDIFTKRSGMKAEPPTTSLSMGYTEITHDYSRQKTRSKLLQIGFSVRGIDELKNGRPLSNPKDRQISAIIIGDALG